MKRLSFFLVLFLLLRPAVAQEEADAAVAKLREGLRNTMLQLRDAQGQIANFQAQKNLDDAKIADLTAQNTKLSKQLAADKSAADRTIADLQAKNAAQDARNAKQVEALGNWKKAYDQLLDQAKKVVAKRDELAAQKIQLDRQVAGQQAKNRAMAALGLEILKRYEHFGLGDAITAREPFVGLTRVKFENLIQDYSDRIADQKIKP
jgi:ABC-type Na+ efflux pump permease subunit